jgi:anaphase-promoting complex subunit 3
MHLKQYESALGELEVLRDQAPDEANVWFLLGKCYKGLSERGEALRAFTTALNLDVKVSADHRRVIIEMLTEIQAAPFIKEAMEALDEEDEESDDD